jgi:hypothetical protein
MERDSLPDDLGGDETMANTSLYRPRWLRRVLGAIALLVVIGLAGGMASLVSAQDAKKPVPPKSAKPKAAAHEQPMVSDIVVAPSGQEQIAIINQEIEKKWRENKLEPSPRCTDYEFIRRASLDVIGRIATPKEIDDFLKQPPRERRSRLIERLLASDEYANHMANLWTVLLLTRTGSKVYHDQMHLWLLEQFEKPDADWSKVVTELLTATGKTSENGAVNFVLAHLGEGINDNPAENGKYNMVPITSRTTRLFLGLRIQCIQCHDHKFNDEWRQNQFWGINAFFRQVDPSARPMAEMKKKKGVQVPPITLTDNPELNREGIVPYERRSGVLLYTRPTFVDGSKMVLKDPGTTRRHELAKFIVKSDYFAKAFVNRMWGHLLGRGFTKEVDDFGEHNPVSHPELLDRLAKDWATRYGHNPRELMRWICNSRVYGLSSVANPTNDKPDAEPYFARVLQRVMTPEQLFDSIMTATQAKIGKGGREDRIKAREAWLEKLVLNFGDDEGNEVTFNGTVVQALLLMNGQELNQAIMDKDHGTVANVLKRRPFTAATAPGAVTQLYLAALNRPPTKAELNRILSPQMINLPRVAVRDPVAFYSGFYQDLMWALLNSNEFILNH